MDDVETVQSLFPEKLRFLWKSVELKKMQIQEIRIRIYQPVIILTNLGERFIGVNGSVIGKINGSEKLFVMNEEMFVMLFSYLCKSSIYAYSEELKRGYFTVKGGHRIGIAGELYSIDQEEVTIRNVRYLNIRIAHELPGVADTVFPYIFQERKYLNTLIISPPGFGKTTILRDLIQQLSNGNAFTNGKKIGVVDERYELQGSCNGVIKNSLGIRTDVLSGCLKTKGIMLLLRSMSPDIIAVDEIGSKKDEEALKSVMQCGCGILATMHGNSQYDDKMSSKLKDYMEQHIFQRYIFLGKEKIPGKINQIYTDSNECLYTSR